MIEMFSNEEMWLFGSVLLKCCLLTLLIFFVIEAAGRYIKAKNETQKPRAEKTYAVDKNSFEEIGKQALAYQTMLSFDVELPSGKVAEFTVEDILEEIKERKNG